MPQKLIFKTQPVAKLQDFLLEVYFEATQLKQFCINTQFLTREVFDPAKVGDLLWGTLQDERDANKRIFAAIYSTYLYHVSDINLAKPAIIAGLVDSNTNLQAAAAWLKSVTFQ